MSPSSPTASGFFDLVGRLRSQANIASRYGQTDDLQRLADELVRWQAMVRTEICKALDVSVPTSLSWESMIELIRNEHERLHRVPVSATEAALRGEITP